MSTVNADVTVLLRTLKNMQTAIDSIEKTKVSISAKYQQLGSGWNDKKYKDLGDVVNDCSKSLNTILKTLLQGEKYVALLVKSLQEYENIDLSGSIFSENAFAQNPGNTADSKNEKLSYQYCLGVMTRGSIPEGYLDVISERYQNGETAVCRVFNSFANHILIQDANYPQNQTPHYSPVSYDGHGQGVYYNAESDMTNCRGEGTTFFHELAHMIDHAATGYQGSLSHTSEFRQALLADGQDFFDTYNNASEEGQINFRNNLRNNNRTHSFQDLVEGSTNARLSFFWGHNDPSRNYWADHGNLESEAFAHFFEASMGAPDKLELLTNWFPRATAVFFNLIKGIVEEPYVRRRVR